MALSFIQFFIYQHIMKIIFYLLPLIYIFCCCSEKLPTDKHLKERNNVIDVRDQIVEIPMEKTPISSFANLYSMGDYIILKDYKSPEGLIYIFEKDSFQCVANVTPLGQGPDEIANIGDFILDEEKGKFHVFDHGKQRLFTYDLDSLVNSPSTYQFHTKAKFDSRLYPYNCCYINDTLSVAAIAEIYEDNTYSEVAGLWNMTTGDLKIGYENPKIKKKRFAFAASEEAGIYVRCYSRYDLMIICNLDGSLRYNVYGPDWKDEKTNTCHYNMDVRIGGDKIYALYSGEDHRSLEFYPSKIVVFDCEGNYIKTLETGYHILHFCYDKENHRLILYTNDEMQFGYLDLEGII